jgi:hypothetical protein
MKILAIALTFISFEAMACWKMQATFSINDDVVKINQKIDHDKTYSFNAGKHLFHVKIPSATSGQTDTHSVEIGSQKKTGLTLSEITQGKVVVRTGAEATMTKLNSETGETTTFTIKISEI